MIHALPNTHRPRGHLPSVVTIAGSDPSGGAGIEADLKTISAHGCYGMDCIAALTAQNSHGVTGVFPTERTVFQAILAAVFSDIRVDAVKTGVLTPEALPVVVEELAKRTVPVVVDPVMVSTSGHALTKHELLGQCVATLFPQATLVTPNATEAVAIMEAIGKPVALPQLVRELEELAVAIRNHSRANAVLVKGGHVPMHGTVSDVLATATGTTVFSHRHIDTAHSHGTGCTLSLAVALRLALGDSVREAVEHGIEYVHAAIVSADPSLGTGSNKPLNHVFASSRAYGHEQSEYANGPFLEHVLSHPSVAPAWEAYTHHPFVAQVADGSLSELAFRTYIEQDHVYLVHYARMCARAAAVAPNMEAMVTQTTSISNIHAELQRHEERLARRGVNVAAIVPLPSTVAYTLYLDAVAENGDWFDIQMSLAPCLHGYHAAAKWAVQVGVQADGEYAAWVGDYVSTWYLEACVQGAAVLQAAAATALPQQIARAIQVFADVCSLEAAFWSEVV